MTDVGKAVQWRSCPEGHLHLGQECPCEHANPRYRTSIRQGPSESSPASGPETDRGAGRRLLRPRGGAGVSVSGTETRSSVTSGIS